jgi:hypothetical protein
MTRAQLLLLLAAALALCFVRYAGLAVVLGVGLMLPGWKRKLLVVLPCLVVYAAALFGLKALDGYLVPNWGQAMRQGWQGTQMFVALSQGFPLLALIGWMAWEKRGDIETRVIVGAVVAYTVGIWAMTVITGGVNIAYDDRLFAPGAVLVVLLTLALVARRLPKAFPWVVVAFGLYIASCNIQQGKSLSRPVTKAFNAPIWRESGVIEIIRDKMDDSVPLYTNAVDGVWYLCKGRKAMPLPVNSVQWGSIYATGGAAAWFKDRHIFPVSPDTLAARVGSRWRGAWQDSSGLIAEVAR